MRRRVSTAPAPRRPIARPPTAGRLRRALATRVLILSWEYPPIVEGGLARHVAKLAEALVAAAASTVNVLTRGRVGDPPQEVRAGVRVHRVPEPRKPRDLDAFVEWVEAMDQDMLDAGRALGAQAATFDVVHGHDWLVAVGRRARSPTSSSCPTSRRSTRPSTAATRAGSTSTRRPTSTASRRWMAQRADRVVVCSSYMRDHVADVFGVREGRVEVIPNGIDPADLGRVDDLEALRARFAAPDEKLVLLVGRLVYEKGFQLALDALQPVIGRVGGVRFLVAGSGTHEAELKAQARAARARRGTARSWAGSATTSCTRSTASPTSAWSPRSTSRSGSWRWRRWPRAAPASWPTPAACARSCPTTTSACASARATRGPWRAMMERVLTDDALRERLVAEASEHVRTFGWPEVARQTAGVYAQLAARAAGRAVGETVR